MTLSGTSRRGAAGSTCDPGPDPLSDAEREVDRAARAIIDGIAAVERMLAARERRPALEAELARLEAAQAVATADDERLFLRQRLGAVGRAVEEARLDDAALARLEAGEALSLPVR